MLQSLLANPLIFGSLAFALLGAGTAHFGKAVRQAFDWIRAQILFTATIDNSDPGFIWLKQWLGENKNFRSVSINTRWFSRGAGELAGRDEEPVFFFGPMGAFVIRFGGRRLFASLHKQEGDKNSLNKEIITIQSFLGSADVVRQIMIEAHAHSTGRRNDSVSVFISSSGGQEWKLCGSKRPRDLSSVILDRGVSERLLRDLNEFLESESKYAQLGIPYHRGYLLHGEPGNGKTSLVHAIASKLKFNLNVLSIASVYNDEYLQSLIAKVPPKHILLIEDIDAVFATGRKMKGDEKVTFSGLINYLDGLTAADGRIVFMSTNHPEKLDKALIRPGRADVSIKIGNATKEQAIEMFNRFHPTALPHLGEEFSNLAVGKSMAEIQGALISADNDAMLALNLIKMETKEPATV